MSYDDDLGPLAFIAWNVKGTMNSSQVYQIKRSINKVKHKSAKPPNLQTKKSENRWTSWEKFNDRPFFSLHVPSLKFQMLRKCCVKTEDIWQINNLDTTFLYLWRFWNVFRKGEIFCQRNTQYHLYLQSHWS